MDVPSNSRNVVQKSSLNSQQDNTKPKIQPVANGKIKEKSRLETALMPTSGGRIKDFLVFDVAIPTVKNIISDVISIFLWGDAGRRNTGGYNGVSGNLNASRVSYWNQYSTSRSYGNQHQPRDDRYSQQRQRINTPDNVIVETEQQACDVLDGLHDIIAEYGVANVGELFDLANMVGQPTDCYYGWFSLQGASYVAVRDGFMLKLPRPVPIR